MYNTQELFEVQNKEFEDAYDNNDDEVQNVPGPSTQTSRSKKVIRDWKFEKKNFVAPDVTWKSFLPNPPLEDYTPFQYFKLFFSDEMFDLIHVESNKYAMQKNGSVPNISYLEIRQYIGILVYMGVVKMPASRVYWSNNCRFNRIADVMSKNRFYTVSRYFHVEDNAIAKSPNSVGYDKLHKVRPLLNILQSNMHDTPPEERHSVDEQMIAFKGRSHLKQYMRNKPHKWGFKVFTRAGASGIMYDFEIYQGKGTCSDYGLGFSGDIVMALASELPEGNNFKIYFDNWFSSLQLTIALKEKQIFCIGTVRQDRMGKCKLKSEKELKKEGL